MRLITRNCEVCSKEFDAPVREVNRGNAKYCSKPCVVEGVRKKSLERSAKLNIPNVECSYCHKMFYKSKHKRENNSKHNLHFCCREHKDLAQRIEFGLKDIQPDHYGVVNTSYRVTAFRHYPPHCNRCKYDAIPEILEVHHKDRDRDNNEVENLEVICSRCHDEEHFLAKDGKWTRYNGGSLT